MSEQTRINFSKQSATASKRRRLDADDEPDEQNERPPQRSKTTNSVKPSLKQTVKQSPSTGKPDPKATKTSSDSDSKVVNTSKNTSKSGSHLTLTYQQASLFDSPRATVLCHATNAQGSWGAGIAAAFKKKYPAAFQIYAAHCKKWKGTSLLGTTLLIPPQNKSALKAEREAEHWIGCLFTGEKYGKGKGDRESILAATGEAIDDLLRKVKDVNEVTDAEQEKSKAGGDRIDAVHMCKINSGLFGVPWEATVEVIENVEVGEDDVKEIAVISLD